MKTILIHGAKPKIGQPGRIITTHCSDGRRLTVEEQNALLGGPIAAVRKDINKAVS